MSITKLHLAEELFQNHGPVLKGGFLRQHGIYSRVLEQLTWEGHLSRPKNGYYTWNAAIDNISDIEVATKLVPIGIVCLQSAAMLYDLSTVNTTAITIAIPSNRTRVALPDHPPIKLLTYPAKSFELGVSKLEGVRVYDRERTVCDFIRKRKQLGNDLMLEVLRSYMRGSRNLQKLFEYAEKLRVKSIIMPYVEALL